ncbi:hypothetical protein [Plantactinospora sp. GCM10030261]|uniref:hypothetical protein n=1 Tax=Plantactinospora sp. GCM10030261 TaxID=3273420 RepID=UPI00360FF415
MSAPPEVVFNTAVDPSRAAAWLPVPLRAGDGPERADGMRARWHAAGWTADLAVEPGNTGGARVRLDLTADPSTVSADSHDRGLAGLAEESLTGLAGEVAENLTAG